MAAAMASGSFSASQPFSRWRTISGIPPTLLATTGTAALLAITIGGPTARRPDGPAPPGGGPAVALLEAPRIRWGPPPPGGPRGPGGGRSPGVGAPRAGRRQ